MFGICSSKFLSDPPRDWEEAFLFCENRKNVQPLSFCPHHHHRHHGIPYISIYTKNQCNHIDRWFERKSHFGQYVPVTLLFVHHQSLFFCVCQSQFSLCAPVTVWSECAGHTMVSAPVTLVWSLVSVRQSHYNLCAIYSLVYMCLIYTFFHVHQSNYCAPVTL